MKNTFKVLAAMRSIAIIAFVAVIGFSMAGCKNDSGPETYTYTGTADGVTYKLEIFATAPRAAITGDTYTLTVTGGGETKTSAGTIEVKVENVTFTLKPTGQTTTFTVTVNTSNGITNITGTITFTDGSDSQEAPENITPGKPSTPVTPPTGGDSTVLKISETIAPLPNGAPTTIDFGYYYVYSRSGAVSLNEIITGTPKVQITGGKLTLELGAPKDEELKPLSGSMYAGITVTPSDVKVCMLECFSNSDATYELYMKGPGDGENDGTALVYVDKDVTINGTGVEGSSGHKETYNNVTFKKGWNYMPAKYTRETDTSTFTASQTKPTGATWTVVAH